MSGWMAAFFSGSAAFCDLLLGRLVRRRGRWNICRAACVLPIGVERVRRARRRCSRATRRRTLVDLRFCSSGPHCLSMRARRLASDDR